ncbi:CPCC family cysteine-rich protein [Flavobacterium sp. CFBP9031]|uniref:CPCC family cysteine-rich protein n=1 Tax=Flavobacterium sp. CFBP9031 TaxID=3096538 RepID=UPI002A6A831F|nr:CPCC family cysteine-rich protein [Flavobacterium sp. CFBP9031]MDY0985936.1 CPCC family cysteine-rich protein [Flavobacterium sp. CFBP9031]
MERNEAKKIIANYELNQMSDNDKIDILERNYWFFDSKEDIIEAIADESYPKISNHLIDLISVTSKPVLNEESESLILDFIKDGFYFVSNSYLEFKLIEINQNFTDKVIGEVEKAGLCPCCEYYSIGYGEDGFYDICPVCFWENGGNGPNHMTLEEAKLNFGKFGAINKNSLDFVDVEGRKKYAKE